MKLPDIVSNPMFPIILLGSCVIIFLIVFIYFKIVKGRIGRVLYFDEIESDGEELNVVQTTSKSLITDSKPMKRFLRTRNSKVYNFRGKFRSIPTWIGKKGTAYLFRPASTPKGKAQKVGSFWDGLKCVLTPEEIENIKPDVQKRLVESEIFVTVDLEEGYTPENMPVISEDWVLNDADDRMAQLFGKSVRDSLSSKEDIVKAAALVGTGVAITLLLQLMGILNPIG